MKAAGGLFQKERGGAGEVGGQIQANDNDYICILFIYTYKYINT